MYDINSQLRQDESLQKKKKKKKNVLIELEQVTA